jgi:hypothetical protein
MPAAVSVGGLFVAEPLGQVSAGMYMARGLRPFCSYMSRAYCYENADVSRLRSSGPVRDCTTMAMVHEDVYPLLTLVLSEAGRTVGVARHNSRRLGVQIGI